MKNEYLVLLAKDVLARIKNKQIIPERTYFYASDLPFINADLKDVYESHFEKNNACNACALGALFIAEIIQKDNFPRKGLNLTNFTKRIVDVIGEEQAILIETAFEVGGDEIWCNEERLQEKRNHLILNGKWDQAIKFGRSYTYKRERMRAIMNNIIKNEGEFIP
jgi:hypothetical protein